MLSHDYVIHLCTSNSCLKQSHTSKRASFARYDLKQCPSKWQYYNISVSAFTTFHFLPLQNSKSPLAQWIVLNVVDTSSMTNAILWTQKQLEVIQRWSAICRVWPWILTYQKFLLCVSSQDEDLYSHQKFNTYIYWFSSESGYRRRRRRQRRTPQYNY